MLNFNWLKKNKLHKEVKVKGVIFTIRKITPMDFAQGSNILLEVYNATAIEKQLPDEMQYKKLMKFYERVFLSCVVKPQLTSKDDPGEKIHVSELLHDLEMCALLYEEILQFTYGKKKYRRLVSQGQKYLTSTQSPSATA